MSNNKKDIITIRQKNALIGHPKIEMSHEEMMLYYTILKHINKEDKGFSFIKIPIHEFVDDWGKNKNHAYKQVRLAVEGLLNKRLEIENPENGFDLIPFLKRGRYVKGQSYVEVMINDQLYSFLLELKEQYTTLDIRNLKLLSNKTTLCLYELMKKWQKIGTFTADYNQLKYLLCVKNYDRNSDFKSYVLLPAIKQINNNSDLEIKLLSVGRGEQTQYRFEIIKKWEKKQKNAKYKTKKSEDLFKSEELFERLWKMYPRKKGKSAVSKTKKLELLKVGEEELTRCINRYKAETKGRDMNYILHGSTFFNGRYKDYLDENYQQEKTDIMNPNDDKYTRYKDCHTIEEAMELAKKYGDI